MTINHIKGYGGDLVEKDINPWYDTDWQHEIFKWLKENHVPHRYEVDNRGTLVFFYPADASMFVLKFSK